MEFGPEKDTESEVLFPQYKKQLYMEVFHLPGPDWQIEAIWDDAYFRAAKTLIEGVARGEYLPALEGVAGLYLFRHYLELALKFITFHSRWLKDAHTNAENEEIENVWKTHSLKQLWAIAKPECQRIVAEKEWQALDIEFVERCVQEFDAVDPRGERFRYHGDKFGIEKDPAKREDIIRASRYDLYIDFRTLPGVVQHVYDVLHYLDIYMIETHGQNEEWQSVLNAF